MCSVAGPEVRLFRDINQFLDFHPAFDITACHAYHYAFCVCPNLFQTQDVARRAESPEVFRKISVEPRPRMIDPENLQNK